MLAAVSQYIRLEELKENLKEAMPIAGSRAKMFVAISCDVCKPEDVSKLASFVVEELGSVDFWGNNAGINKGFTPLLQFTVEDIVQGSYHQISGKGRTYSTWMGQGLVDRARL